MDFPKNQTNSNQKNFNNDTSQQKTKTNSSKKPNEKSKKSETITKKNKKIISKNKIKKRLPIWKKLEFPISQFTGKIQKNYKKLKFPKYLDKDDIDIILKLISKESKNFAPVKSNTKLTFIFILLIISSFAFGITFLFKKKYFLGIILIIVFLILCFIYIHIIRKSIKNKYKKCHQDLFYLTDYINRKFLCDIGYYLLIDYNFKFIGIYTLTNYIREILKYRDHNIELKKKLEGDTIDHLHKKERINQFDKSNSFINNTFYNNNYKNIFNTNINQFTFGLGYNYNNKMFYTFNNNNLINNDINNSNNDITFDDGNNESNVNQNKVKFNNFFKNKENKEKENNIVGLKNEEIIIDIPLKRRKINKDNKNEIKNENSILNKSLSKKENKKSNNNNNDNDKYKKFYGKKYEEMNSQANNRSIDKFKDYIENKYNGLGILNNYKYK